MPSGLAAMRRVLTSIFEWIRRARRHVQTRRVFRLVTIAAFDRIHAVTIRTTAQAKGRVRTAILALQGRIACRMTVDAASVAEDFERFQESCPCPRIITGLCQDDTVYTG